MILGLDPGAYVTVVVLTCCAMLAVGTYVLYRAGRGEDHARQATAQHRAEPAARVRAAQGKGHEQEKGGSHRKRR